MDSAPLFLHAEDLDTLTPNRERPQAAPLGGTDHGTVMARVLLESGHTEWLFPAQHAMLLAGRLVTTERPWAESMKAYPGDSCAVLFMLFCLPIVITEPIRDPAGT